MLTVETEYGTYSYDGEHLYSKHGTKLSGKFRHFRSGKHKKTLQVAAVIWRIVRGEWPGSDIQVDHIDGNWKNNSVENLRLVDHSGNMRNKRMHSNVRTGIMGVQWKNSQDRWDSGIAGKRLYWGDDFFEACCVRRSAELRENFHPNHGRK